MKGNPCSGQGLLEVAFALPVLLLLLAGSYLCCRGAFLQAAAESAAYSEAIRAGRKLPGIEGKMAYAILPQGNGVKIRPDRAGRAGILPAPFPSLDGRTKGIVEINDGVCVAGGYPQIPPLQVFRASEASVDCWENKSPSGKKVRRFLGGWIATRALR